MLAADGHTVSCTVIGSGDQRAELQELAERFGVSDVLELAGARTHQQIAAAYRDADVFVQASVVLANGDRDGIPNSLLEAMASGLAVVATDVAGIPEAVVPGSGLLVEQGSARALADALASLVTDPDLRARLGAAARAHVVASLDRSACVAAIAPLFGGSPPGAGLVPAAGIGLVPADGTGATPVLASAGTPAVRAGATVPVRGAGGGAPAA